MTLTEMRDYKRAAETLEKLTEVFCLLVFYESIFSQITEMKTYQSWVIFFQQWFDLQKKPDDPDVFRLLGEVKYELKDYEGSVASYKSAERVSLTDILF